MYIEIQTIDNIGIMALNRAATNSMNKKFLLELKSSLNHLEEMDSVKVVSILSKLPFGFSSGLDLRSFFNEESPKQTADNIFEAVEIVYQINQIIRNSKKIYVAALAGPVIGSAVSIALSCDLRIADETTWFWLPDPQYGGLLADGGIEMLKGMVGESRAYMMLLTNDRINVSTAYEWGLLYAVTHKNCVNETAMRLCTRLASYSSQTLGLTKKIMNKHVMGEFHRDKLRKVVDSTEMYNRMQSYLNNRNTRRD